MEITHHATPRAWTPARSLRARVDPPALGSWTLAFALVLYLALSGGGYDAVVRSEVGIAVWWIVLLGALAGILPARVGAAGWVAIALLTAFAAWTGLAIGWSESAERSAVELGRVAAYLGVLVLAIALQGATAARHTINGLACAIGLVTLLAVLSRALPQAFPVNDHLEFLGSAVARKLSYPLNYWNALAAFAAMGVPLLLAIAVAGRTLAGQAAAAAVLPLSALCIYLTISRGGALGLVAGLIVFVVLVPRRLPAIGTLLVAGAGAAILISGASQRAALLEGTLSDAAIAQGRELVWLVVIVCLGVAFVQVAMGLAARHLRRPPALVASRRATAAGALLALFAAAVVAVAAGAPAAVSERFTEFKAPLVVAGEADDTVFNRLRVANGNGRYQLWETSAEAARTDPARGIGPGTFEFFWARNGTTAAFVRDAHSLYMETLAETGIVGLVLLGGALLWLVGTLIVRALRAPPRLRLWLAAAGGSLTVFLAAAAIDWMWEMGAVAAAAMLLGGVIVAGRDEVDGDPPAAGHRVPRVVLALLALVALAAILVPLAGTLAARDSRAAAASGRLDTALEDSRTAQRLQPYAATPHLQSALVLEEAGDLDGAADAARAATVQEPTNWRTWLVLARVDARRGRNAAALRELRRARALNPRSALFATP